MIEFTFNGGAAAAQEGQRLADLLKAEALDRPGVAVAINREVIPRKRWEDTVLTDGDQIEVIHAVQGG